MSPSAAFGCQSANPGCMLLSDDRGIVFVLNLEGRIIFAPASVARMLSVDPRGMVGKSLLDWLEPEDRSPFRLVFDNVIHRRELGVITIRIKDAKHKWRSLEAFLRPACDNQSGGHVVVLARDITEMCQLESRLHQATLIDDLTGLANRRSAYARFDDLLVELAEKPDALLAVALIDIDRFSLINDVFGHKFGDQVLRAIANRMRECDVSSEMVGRLGSDQFLVVWRGRDIADFDRAIEEFCRAMSMSFRVAAQDISVSGSIGVSLAPVHGSDRVQLMRRADIALRRAKLCGGWSVRSFDVESEEITKRRAELEQRLRDHLANDSLSVFYQPIVRIGRPELVGFEALLRYDRELGASSVEEVIDVADDCGLIAPVDEFVIKKAVAFGQKMNELARGDLIVSVNVSPAFIRDRDLSGFVDATLAAHDIAPGLLQLEITERVMIAHYEAAMQVLGAVARRGVRIALDDFGVGFSSLTHLHRFPIHCLKIDRSFTVDLPSSDRTRAIVEAMTMVAGRLRLDVVAEGIETPEQEAAAASAGCTEGQGYLYARPLAGDDFRDFLGGWQSNNLEYAS